MKWLILTLVCFQLSEGLLKWVLLFSFKNIVWSRWVHWPMGCNCPSIENSGSIRMQLVKTHSVNLNKIKWFRIHGWTNSHMRNDSHWDGFLGFPKCTALNFSLLAVRAPAEVSMRQCKPPHLFCSCSTIGRAAQDQAERDAKCGFLAFCPKMQMNKGTIFYLPSTWDYNHY